MEQMMRVHVKSTIFAITIFGFTAVNGFARHPKIAADLGDSQPDQNVGVIIQYHQIPNEAHHQKVRQKGGRLDRGLELIRGARYTIAAGQLEDLANDPDVEYISPDRPVKAFLDNTTAAVNAQAAWATKFDGTGVGIAIIDSGISNHDDLKDSKGALRVV